MRCGSEYEAKVSFCPQDGARLMAKDGGGDALVGTVLLDQFRIEEPIGSGGMGTVYRATQTSVGRELAIKVLRPELVENDSAVKRFQREARLATALDHPNLVRVLLSGQLPDGRIYIVMELLKGRSLADALETEGVLPLDRAITIVLKLCAGIDAVHAEGIVHRDIKPENVFLVRRGNDQDFVKVVDFGIARMLDGSVTTTTQSGRVFGTASYISPEGAAGDPTDLRSDVYSIAVLAYQLLCGELPFEGPNPGSVLMQHVHKAADDLTKRGCGERVPRGVGEVIMRSLAKNPDARHQTVAEFVEALAEAATAAGVLQEGRALLLGTMWSQELTSPGTSLAGLMDEEPRRSQIPTPIPMSPMMVDSAPRPLSPSSAPPALSSVAPGDERVMSEAPDPFRGTQALELQQAKQGGNSRLKWIAGGLSALLLIGLIWWMQKPAEETVAEPEPVTSTETVAAAEPEPALEPVPEAAPETEPASVTAPETESAKAKEPSQVAKTVAKEVPAAKPKAAPAPPPTKPKTEPEPPATTPAPPVAKPEPAPEPPPEVEEPQDKPKDKPPSEGIDWTLPDEDDGPIDTADPDAPEPPPKSPEVKDLEFEIPPPPEPDPQGIDWSVP